MSDSMREAFEKWMSARGCKFQLGRGGDCYSNPLTQKDWETWQAALQSQKAPAVPEGWAMVPVEPTSEMRRKAGLHRGADYYTIRIVWREMLAAAPQPAHSPDGGKVVYQCPRCSTSMEVDLAAKPAPAADGGEVVGWQFYQDGKWHNGDDTIKDHRANTEAAGIPVRNLYAHPAPPPNEVQAEAIQTLRANIRQQGRTVQQVGIRDNDKTRAAIAVLLDSDARLRSNGGEG